MLSVLLLAYLKAEITRTFFLSSLTFKILLFLPIIKSYLYTPKKSSVVYCYGFQMSTAQTVSMGKKGVDLFMIRIRVHR